MPESVLLNSPFRGIIAAEKRRFSVKALFHFLFLRVFNSKNSGVLLDFLKSAILGANADKCFSCFANFEAR